ncbi:tpr domain protein, partial [Apiospora aurea]
MSNTMGSGSGTSQNFGNSSVSTGGRLFQDIVQGDVHLHGTATPFLALSQVIPATFGRDADFVQRGDIMDRLHQFRAQSFSRTALVGLGGVGKSQLAIEYAYQVRSARRFEMDFQNIANYAKLPGRDNPQVDGLQLVTNWLISESSGKWIIILDNVDSADFLFDSSQNTHPGRPHLDAALKLVELPSIIQVDPMSQAEAVALAEKKLGKSDDKMEYLADSLEYIPLAIYLEKFAQSDHDKTNLLNFEGGQLRRDPEAKNSIIITWQLMFDHIHQTRPSAAHLLSYMSVFNSQIIWGVMLRPPVFEPQHSRLKELCPVHNICKSWDQGSFDEDVLLLADCSLISIMPEGRFGMHSLVQLATRRWLEATGHQGFVRWQHHLMDRLYFMLSPQYDSSEYATWVLVNQWEVVPGLQRVRQRHGFLLIAEIMFHAPECPQDKAGINLWAKLQTGIAFYYMTKLHAPTCAISNVIAALEPLDDFIEDSHLAPYAADLDCITWMSLDVIETVWTVRALYQQGEDFHRNSTRRDAYRVWDAVIEMQTGRVDDAKRDHGDVHARTLTLMNQLALLYLSQDSRKEAFDVLHQIRTVVASTVDDDPINTFSDPRLINWHIYIMALNMYEETEETHFATRALIRLLRSGLGLTEDINEEQDKYISNIIDNGFKSISGAVSEELGVVASCYDHSGGDKDKCQWR